MKHASLSVKVAVNVIKEITIYVLFVNGECQAKIRERILTPEEAVEELLTAAGITQVFYYKRAKDALTAIVRRRTLQICENIIEDGDPDHVTYAYQLMAACQGGLN